MNFIPFDIECFEKLKEKFQYLFEEELINEICQHGKLKNFDADKVIIDVGDEIEYMPLVLTGSIKVLAVDSKGDELLLYFLEFGDTCAVTLNCCTRKAKSAIKGITESSAEVLFIPVEFMEIWMVKYKSWRNYVLDSFNVRLNEMVQSIDNIVFNSMEERLLNYLKDKAWLAKSKDLSVSHAQIANDLHSSRVVISRLMKKLEQQGEIEQGRNKVRLVKFME